MSHHPFDPVARELLYVHTHALTDDELVATSVVMLV